MSNLVPFSFEGAAVRVIEQDGAPWFVLVDVCVVLGIANPRDAAGRLDDDEKGVGTTDTLGGQQEATIINESGLWSLVLTSRKATAKRFKKWVTADVIPTIRRTGGYGAPQLDPNDPAQLRQILLGYSERLERTEKALEVAQVSAAGLDRLAGTEGTRSITDAAKALKVRPKVLFKFLSEDPVRWIYKRAGCSRYIGYQAKIQAGYLTHVSTIVERRDGSEKTVENVHVTSKGLAKLSTMVPGAHRIGGADAQP